GQQWLPHSLVEGGVATVGQRDGAGCHGLSLSAGNQQMEQDRASLILPHHYELARPPVGQLSGNCQSDWGHYHGDGVTGAGGLGHGGLSHQGEGDRRATGNRGSASTPLPRRVELYDQASND